MAGGLAGDLGGHAYAHTRPLLQKAQVASTARGLAAPVQDGGGRSGIGEDELCPGRRGLLWITRICPSQGQGGHSWGGFVALPTHQRPRGNLQPRETVAAENRGSAKAVHAHLENGRIQRVFNRTQEPRRGVQTSALSQGQISETPSTPAPPCHGTPLQCK